MLLEIISKEEVVDLSRTKGKGVAAPDGWTWKVLKNKDVKILKLFAACDYGVIRYQQGLQREEPR